MARIETGTLAVDPQPVDLTVLVEQASPEALAFSLGTGRRTSFLLSPIPSPAPGLGWPLEPGASWRQFPPVVFVRW